MIGALTFSKKNAGMSLAPLDPKITAETVFDLSSTN
jgi:hypothetical protein